MRAVAGALLPRAGIIRFRGRDITRLRSDERTNLGIALVPEGRHVFPFLTVRENLELGGFKFRNEAAKVSGLVEKMFAMFPKLSARASQNAGTLSGGEQQMLVLGRAMMSEPLLLCLRDGEALCGGRRYALETASRGYVLQTGAIIASGSCSELKQDERVHQAYLGRAAVAPQTPALP